MTAVSLPQWIAASKHPMFCQTGHELVQWDGTTRKKCFHCRKPGTPGYPPLSANTHFDSYATHYEPKRNQP